MLVGVVVLIGLEFRDEPLALREVPGRLRTESRGGRGLVFPPPRVQPRGRMRDESAPFARPVFTPDVAIEARHDRLAGAACGVDLPPRLHRLARLPSLRLIRPR